MQARIRELEQSYKELLRVHQKTERAKLELTRRLKRKEVDIQRYMYVFGPRIYSLLVRNRDLRQIELQALKLMLQLALGHVTYERLKHHLKNRISSEDLAKLFSYLNGRSRHKRNRALTLLFHLCGVPKGCIVSALGTYPRTVTKHIRTFKRFGVDAAFPSQKRVVKMKEPKYKEAIFSILHSPPKDHGFNRTTWRIKDIAGVMARNGIGLGKNRVGTVIRNAGYRFMKARKVLTSNDPNYREKVDRIHQILSSLKQSERFFSIDEFGPVAVKKQGGRRLVGPGEYPTVPQFQISKGFLIVTAALELSTNQVTHFYSNGKNTDEMIKLLEILLAKYHNCTRLYFSWDAAGWHASKRFVSKVAETNSRDYRRSHRTPMVEMAPLPGRAQFLNVIESVFSGLAVSVIHNSDYPSVDDAKAAIDRYFAERNSYFKKNPRRAGRKIWGKESVAIAFQESQNCKHPRFR